MECSTAGSPGSTGLTGSPGSTEHEPARRRPDGRGPRRPDRPALCRLDRAALCRLPDQGPAAGRTAAAGWRAARPVPAAAATRPHGRRRPRCGRAPRHRASNRRQEPGGRWTRRGLPELPGWPKCRPSRLRRWRRLRRRTQCRRQPELPPECWVPAHSLPARPAGVNPAAKRPVPCSALVPARHAAAEWPRRGERRRPRSSAGAQSGPPVPRFRVRTDRLREAGSARRAVPNAGEARWRRSFPSVRYW